MRIEDQRETEMEWPIKKLNYYVYAHKYLLLYYVYVMSHIWIGLKLKIININLLIN